MPLLPQLAVPQSPAKAAAFDRWLAQGGKPGRKSRKFLSGPQKGMTYDQAMQKFEGMWAGAPDALKEKYAKRAGDFSQVAPSERPAVQPPKDMSPAAVQKRRMAYYGHEFDKNGKAVPIGQKTSAKPAYDKDRNGVPDMIQRDPVTINPSATSGAGRGKAIGTPAEQAKVAQMVNEGEKYGTAAYGQWGGMGDTAMYSAIAMGRARDKAAAINPQTAAEVQAVQDKERAPVQAASQVAAEKRIVDDVSATRSAAGLAPLSPEEIMRSRQQPATAPTPTPAVAQAPVPATPAPAIPAVTPPMEAPTGRPVIGSTPPKVNRLTGLPMGYMPGDSTNGMDGAMKARVDASTARMQSVAPPPRAIPVVAPAPPKSVEQRAADEMRRQAAINANPGRVNPDDPRKFFTGRVKPLDQLVAAYRPR